MKKKKIVFINNHFQHSDGTARALIEIVNNLDPNKFDITVKPLFKCDYSLKKELRNDIKLEKFIGFYFKGLSRFIKLLPLKFLYKKIIGYKYDIEIAFQCDLPTLIVGNSLNDKATHICWMHGYQLHPNEFKKSDMVVCVSKYCAEKAKKEMPDYKKIYYRYNILNDRKISSLSTEKLQKNTFKKNVPIFISVGRHSYEKGYIRLIKILYELKNEGYNFQMILVGDGPEHKKISNFIIEKNMQDDVILIGTDPNPHKYTIISDLFICSSYSEGYSTACTEAAILGIPIITTNVPGGKEIIDDCKCGLVSENTDSSLKECIKYVLDNNYKIKEWKETLKKSKNNFSSKHRIEEMNELFDNIYKIALEKGEKYE